jgi:DNA-binding PadR family transcriptional regulator
MAPRQPSHGSRSSAAAGRASDDLRAPAYWLVLGLVIEQSSHGYEISHRYEARFRDVVPLTVPRVYAALDRLRDDGLIELLELEDATEVPKRHLMRRSYRANARGVEAYRGWLVEQLQQDPLRARLLARVISVSGIGLKPMLEVIDRYEQICLEQLRALPGPADPAVQRAGGLDQIAATLLVDQQRRELSARYDWAVHARQVLEAQAEESSAES